MKNPGARRSARGRPLLYRDGDDAPGYFCVLLLLIKKRRRRGDGGVEAGKELRTATVAVRQQNQLQQQQRRQHQRQQHGSRPQQQH